MRNKLDHCGMPRGLKCAFMHFEIRSTLLILNYSHIWSLFNIGLQSAWDSVEPEKAIMCPPVLTNAKASANDESTFYKKELRCSCPASSYLT